MTDSPEFEHPSESGLAGMPGFVQPASATPPADYERLLEFHREPPEWLPHDQIKDWKLLTQVDHLTGIAVEAIRRLFQLAEKRTNCVLSQDKSEIWENPATTVPALVLGDEFPSFHPAWDAINKIAVTARTSLVQGVEAGQGEPATILYRNGVEYSAAFQLGANVSPELFKPMAELSIRMPSLSTGKLSNVHRGREEDLAKAIGLAEKYPVGLPERARSDHGEALSMVLSKWLRNTEESRQLGQGMAQTNEVAKDLPEPFQSLARAAKLSDLTPKTVKIWIDHVVNPKLERIASALGVLAMAKPKLPQLKEAQVTLEHQDLRLVAEIIEVQAFSNLGDKVQHVRKMLREKLEAIAEKQETIRREAKTGSSTPKKRKAKRNRGYIAVNE